MIWEDKPNNRMIPKKVQEPESAILAKRSPLF